MQKKRVLMKDIAAEAGVHQTTVSLALRNHPSLPKKTRDRIQKLAKKMGYKPDPAMSALVAYRQSAKQTPAEQVIGLVLNFINMEDFEQCHVHRRLIATARERAQELGYKLDVFWFGQEYPDGKSLNRVLKARGIQGLILSAFDYKNLDLQMDWDYYSVVKINILPEELKFDAVLSNQMFDVRLAMRELRKHGLTRVGLAVAKHDEAHNRNMFTAGYYVGQRHLAPQDRVPPLCFDDKSMEEIKVDVKNWAREHKLEAIISNWNNFDEEAYELTTEEGQSCRFVPLDADDRTEQYGGVLQNHHLAGRRAIDMVVGQIKTFRRGEEESPSLTLIHPTWLPLSEWPPENFEPQPEPSSRSSQPAMATA
ncbi:MAG: LacI family DNA-binding transcriptional regulator [Verrucomicrobiota bacterium]